MTNPTIRFLLQHPAHFFALGFGSGLAKYAPGTFGTLVAFPLFLLMPNNVLGLLIIAALFILGVYFCEVTGKNLGVPDHGAMVWDEIVAFLLLLYFVTPSGLFWLVAFILFRLFDIWKPFPIRYFDAKLKGGFGVMFDDILAALYALLSLLGLQWLMTHF
ncbi:MAG: phosphatidylglycerophosphatase A [Methylotenera sp.]|nr:phosphatidylglycerophosphatase A [Methylotenera sp.]